MRRIREVLRLKAEGRSHREIACSAGISVGSVSDYVRRSKESGLAWSEASTMGDADVEARLFRHVGRNEPQARAPIDFDWVHRELRRPGVTLQLLWVEYRDAASAGGGGLPYGYSQFCEHYRVHRARLQPVMRQVHRAGEKGFVDYSGKKPHIVDRETGARVEVELFVMVLGASNYTYAEATRTQGLPDFVGSTVRAFEYFGAVPAIVVPDQLRSAVSGPDRYDPEINPTYAEMAAHYGVAIVPARPRKPRDKAKVEGGVLIVQRWILACIRNRTFFSIEELNVAIGELLELLNTRPFQKLEGNRRALFESIERPVMKALPRTRYSIGAWKKARVNIDYHFEYDGRYYSVHHSLMNAPIEVRATASTIEAWRGGVRVAAHARSYARKGTATTLEEHRPKSHRDYGDWPPERLVSWAEKTGPKTAEVIAAILARQVIPEQGYRSCLGLLRAVKQYGDQRTEAACARAVSIGSPTRKSVSMILKRGLDRTPIESATTGNTHVARPHENVRGADYYAVLDKPVVH